MPVIDGSYSASDRLTSAVLAGILSPLPFVVRMAAKALPRKELVVRAALSLAVPTGVRAVAAAHSAGEQIQITRKGSLTPEVQESLFKRIAGWFVPGEMKEMSRALDDEIRDMAQAGFEEHAWKLEHVSGEIVIHVLNTSFLKVTSDTVAETFMNSFEALKSYRDRLPRW